MIEQHISPQIILMEALIRLEREIPPWISTSVSGEEDLEGCEYFGCDIELDSEATTGTIDRLSERYLAPMVSFMINQLGDIRAKAGADREIVFFRLPLSPNDVWSEEIRSKKVAMRLRKRYQGDSSHFDLAYKIQKIPQVAAA